MARKKQFNWAPNGELLEWLRVEAKRLRMPVTQALECAVEHWRATIETSGDAKWLPGYVPPVPELVEYCQLPECGHAPISKETT